MPFYLQMSKNITDPRDIYDSYISILTNLLRTDNETKSVIWYCKSDIYTIITVQLSFKVLYRKKNVR